MSEQWKFVKRLEKDGDALYSSSAGRFLVACERPSDLDDIDGYILDVDAICRGEVVLNTDSEGGYIFGFPRREGYPIYERNSAARELHKALSKLDAAPRKLTWKVTFDVEAPL